jgi:hypothetical protein
MFRGPERRGAFYVACIAVIILAIVAMAGWLEKKPA